MGGERHALATLTPGQKNPVPILQEAGWAPGLVWTGAENLVHTEIGFPDRTSRSESLYRLSYPGPLKLFRPELKSGLFAHEADLRS